MSMRRYGCAVMVSMLASRQLWADDLDLSSFELPTRRKRGKDTPEDLVFAHTVAEIF